MRAPFAGGGFSALVQLKLWLASVTDSPDGINLLKPPVSKQQDSHALDKYKYLDELSRFGFYKGYQKTLLAPAVISFTGSIRSRERITGCYSKTFLRPAVRMSDTSTPELAGLLK